MTSALIMDFPALQVSDENIKEFDSESPISKLTTPSGTSIVLSRYGDPQWDLSPYIKTANSGSGSCMITWNTRNLPDHLISSCKEAVITYWKYGVYGKKRPEARTVVGFAQKLLVFAEWLHSKGITQFNGISDVIVSEYIKSINHSSRNLKPSTREHYFSTLETLFTLNDKLRDSIQQHPWPDQSSTILAGRASAKYRESGTEIIPQDIAQAIFQKAESLIDKADELLNAKDELQKIANNHAGKHPTTISRYQSEWLEANGLKNEYCPSDIIDMTELSTACYVVIAMLSGMRNHEISSVEVGGYYESEVDDEILGWIKGESHKTFEGATEWMAPPIVGLAIDIQQRISEEHRCSLKAELEQLELTFQSITNEKDKQKIAKRLAEIRDDINRIFLCERSGGQIGNLTDNAWRRRLKYFAKEFDWHLHPHQFRRTFAVFVAHNAMGDLRYLRHHYKHWSMDMTLLYARNEKQDQELYEEMLSQIQERKISVVEHWLDDSTPISGGKINQLREYRKRHEVKILKDRRMLAETISDQVNIRGTGHSWCLSDGQVGCGGKGLYEMTRCGGCNDGIVDDTHKIIWMNLHEQQKELLDLTDIGPGGHQRVLRDLDRIEKVLVDLEIPFVPAITEQIQ